MLGKPLGGLTDRVPAGDAALRGSSESGAYGGGAPGIFPGKVFGDMGRVLPVAALTEAFRDRP